MRRVYHDDEDRQQHLLDLDEIAHQGARRMLAEALESEVEAYLEAARGEREVLLGTGAVEVRASRVNDRRVNEHGERRRF